MLRYSVDHTRCDICARGGADTSKPGRTGKAGQESKRAAAPVAANVAMQTIAMSNLQAASESKDVLLQFQAHGFREREPILD